MSTSTSSPPSRTRLCHPWWHEQRDGEPVLRGANGRDPAAGRTGTVGPTHRGDEAWPHAGKRGCERHHATRGSRAGRSRSGVSRTRSVYVSDHARSGWLSARGGGNHPVHSRAYEEVVAGHTQE